MFYTKRKAALFFIVCLIFFFLTYNDVKSSEINSVSGYAKVTDGDTLKINTFKILKLIKQKIKPNLWSSLLRTYSKADTETIFKKEKMITLVEYYYGKNKKMIVSNYQEYMSNTNTKVLTAYYSPSKMFGKSKSQVRADENLTAEINNNPMSEAVFQVIAYSVIGSQRDTINL